MVRLTQVWRAIGQGRTEVTEDQYWSISASTDLCRHQASTDLYRHHAS